MPNSFESCQIEENGDNSEPISFKAGIEDFLGSFARINLENREDTVKTAIPATIGVLARGCSDQDSDAYADYA